MIHVTKQQQEWREEFCERLSDLLGYGMLLDCLLFAREDGPAELCSGLTRDCLKKTLSDLIGQTLMELKQLTGYLLFSVEK